MLYLSQPAKTQSQETHRALNAADGYLYFNMLDEALAELGAIPDTEQKEAAVMLARIRLLLHKREWRSAEVLSAQGTGLHPEEGEFTVQRAFALHQMDKDDKAEQVMQAAPDWIRRTGILHYNLACYEARLGDISTARECIDAAIQINAGIKKSARIDPDLQSLWN
jgi:thioredoxin-like negative regulator of GroEL